MRDRPTLSVVMPAFNERKTIHEALERVLEAPIDSLEIIVVDDGSTDGTADLLAAQPWAVIAHQANAGPAAARNVGWRRATAPVVAFLDDDCAPEPSWPLGLLGAFADETVVGAGGRISGTQDRALDAYVEVERLVDHGRDVPGGVDYLVTANAAFRVEALAAVGGFDEAFPGAAGGEDVDLSWRLRRTGGRLVRSPASVRHDHRSTVREILRTHAVHGRGRPLLEARHPGATIGASARRALAPVAWAERWATYRSRGVRRGAAVGLVALRIAGLASFAVARRRAGRSPLASR